MNTRIHGAYVEGLATEAVHVEELEVGEGAYLGGRGLAAHGNGVGLGDAVPVVLEGGYVDVTAQPLDLHLSTVAAGWR